MLEHADTAERQEAAVAALTFKTEVLWTQLDALVDGLCEGGGSAGGVGAWRGLRLRAAEFADSDGRACRAG